MNQTTARQALRQLAVGTAVILRGILWAGEWRETLARWVLAAIAAAFALSGAALHPWLWPVLMLGWMVGAFAAAPTPEYDDQDDEDDEEFVQAAEAAEDDDDEQLLDADLLADTIHAVARGGNVHLATIGVQLHKETGRAWDVLALCRAHGIRTRPVRVAGADPAVTTGIHRTDLPPLPRPLSASGDVVYAGHADNNNTDISTERIGKAGVGWINRHGPAARQEARR